MIRIRLQGCDDDTSMYIHDVDLTGEQLWFLSTLAAELNQLSDYSCKPKMHIELGVKEPNA